MKIIFPMVLMVLASTAHAGFEDLLPKDVLPEAKLTSEDAQKVNFGVGVTQQLLHLNAEWVNPYGIAYTKLGAFYNGDHELGAQIGFRYPIILTGTDKNGYYLGLYGGHLKSKSIRGVEETQLGGGIDLSYVLLNKERISTFSVGVGAGEEVKKGDTVFFETKPQLQFAYSLSVGFF